MPASRVIAIDGPSASGKSSTAAAVAGVLGAAHLDSGALYRGLALVALTEGAARRVAPEAIAADQLISAAERRGLGLVKREGGLVAELDGVPADARIRTPEVTRAVSPVSALSPLREWVNARLRRIAEAEGLIVVDGRDIGTVVFPEAGLKVFLTATPLARARRRSSQWGRPVDDASVAGEAAALAARDQADSTRAVAPLRPAADALRLDTTELTFEEQVAWIVARARERGMAPA